MQLSAKERRAVRAALKAATDFHRSFSRARRPTGLGLPATEALLALALDAPATATEIGSTLGRDLPAASRALEELREAGFARERAGEGSGRGRPHELTPKGESAVASWLGAAEP